MSTSTTAKKRRFADLDDFDEASSSSSNDAFETYILSPTFKVMDPLKYWDAQLKANSDEGLARFALDYLSAPGKFHYNNSSSLKLITLILSYIY